MILPIVAFGHPILRKTAEPIEADYPNLKQLIEDMFETMYAANGVGLAAPQINKSIRLIVIDASVNEDEKEDHEPIAFKKVFINSEIIEEWGDEWAFNEGCLSLPTIHEDVMRPSNLKIKYMDENFVEHVETYDGIVARVIQHESDHLNGKVFVDRVPLIRKMLLKGTLNNISKGEVEHKYKMIFPNVKKGRR